MSLSDKLALLADTMSDAERANYKFLLGMAAGGLVRDGRPPQRGLESLSFSTAVESITKLQPHRARVPPNGIVYRGRPSFVTDELLADLQAESTSLRPKAVRFDDHFVSSGGTIARGVAYSTDLDAVLRDHTDHLAPTGRANYLYYDSVGLGIDPHIDNEMFSLNVIMMLEHCFSGNPSALVVYPPRAPEQRIYLQPGELVVLYADSTTHARERMAPREIVRIVAFGFQPIR